MKFLKNKTGATAIEYALIAALISLAIISAIGFVGSSLDDTFSAVGSGLTQADDGATGGDDGGGGGAIGTCTKNSCTH